jgi:hypothetical protein
MKLDLFHEDYDEEKNIFFKTFSISWDTGFAFEGKNSFRLLFPLDLCVNEF